MACKKVSELGCTVMVICWFTSLLATLLTNLKTNSRPALYVTSSKSMFDSKPQNILTYQLSYPSRS